MSIQTLLPRDCLLRQISICFDKEDLPVSYHTVRGRTKERNALTLLEGEINKDVSHLISKCLPAIKSNRIDRCDFDCNFSAWKLIDALLSDEVINSDFFLDSQMASDIVAASDITSVRLGDWVGKLDSQKIRSKYDDQSSLYHRFMSLATYLEETRDCFTRAVRKSLDDWRKEGSFGVFEVPNPFGRKRRIKYYQVDKLVIVKIIIKEGKSRRFIFTNTHFSRVVDYLKSCAIFSYYCPDINGCPISFKDYIYILRYQSKFGVISPNGVGSIFKTARQFLFLMGDKGRVLGRSPADMFESGLSGVKLKYGREVAEKLLETTCDRKSALNLSNIFRIVPHPDADMKDVFESVSGFSEANKVKVGSMPRFRGNVRKTMYQSLVAQRFDVRLKESAFHTDMIGSFVSKVNSTSTPIASIMDHGYAYWDSIEFEEVRGLFDHDDQDIPVSNKSSAPNSRITSDEINSIGSIDKLSDYKAVRDKLRALNDVMSVLEGNSELDFVNARLRFINVVKAHEAFEDKYLQDGVDIDDIPSENLEEFVIGNKDSAYTVLTEPKLGEVHKEVTRLFYMAEQALKIMTQVTERAVKKIISKSAGISIVKSFRSRRKEIEEMLYAYTGLNIDQEGGTSVIYISFDMSEFSKKFPQCLVRAIGKVMSELTGEDWMRRIDVFFRAAVVYHNSRGFLGKKSGVTGGFEGFLNFLWTLAMKVVMDIATESTGVEGVLAVYSDDGLLRLYIDGDSDEVKSKINVIKDVFKNYGLIFHLDKTAVSREILEYLGMYGQEGMLIPTWVKETMSIGKRKQTPGLETTYDKIQLWDAQCNAVVKAQGPVYPSMLIKTVLSIQTLRRLNRRCRSSILAILTMIPSSAGGFRVSSITESSLLSSIEGFSEFSSDLQLLSNDYKNQSNAIAITIFRCLKEESEAEKSILTGSFLQTRLIDTSGRGLAVQLVEDAGISSDLTPDPLTPNIVKGAINELKNCINISHKTIRELVSQVPDMILYNKSLSLVKSSAALRFVKRESIQRAQRRDTRLCEQSITFWNTTISEYSGKIGIVSAQTFMDMVKDKLYPSFNFSPFKESPRTALIPCDENPDIICTFEITKNDQISNQEYKEPKYKSLGVQLSPEIVAETSFNTKDRMNERFIVTAARLASTNPTLIHLYYILAEMFHLPCPSLPSSNVMSEHRTAKNSSSNSVVATLPCPYHALVNSRIGHNLYNSLRGKVRSDRTTYTEASRIAGYLLGSSECSGRRVLKRSMRSYLFNINNLERNTSNPTFESFKLAPKNLIKDRVTKTFTDVMIEEKAQMRMLDNALTTNGLIDCIKDNELVKAIMLSKASKWMRTVISGSKVPPSIPVNIPEQWRDEVLTEACVSVSFDESSALVRQMIQRVLNDFIYGDKSEFNILNSGSDHFMMELNSAIGNREQIFIDYNTVFRRVTSSIAQMGLDERCSRRFEEMVIWEEKPLRSLITFLRRRAVQGGIKSPTVVINSNTFADTKMSREVKNNIKSVVDSTISRYLERACSDHERGVDQRINLLIIMKNMLRPSGHRSNPFNKHMVMIELIKFDMFIHKRLDEGHTSVSIQDLDDYRLSGRVVNSIVRNNYTIRGSGDSGRGSDMRYTMTNKGVLNCMLARSNYILRKLGSRSNNQYIRSSINEVNLTRERTMVHRIMEHVLDEYKNVLKSSVDNLQIIHRRESDLVMRSITLTPVDEVSMIMANTVTDTLVGVIVDMEELLDNDTYSDLVANLAVSHSMRWNTDGYISSFKISKILRKFGVMGSNEMSVMSNRTGSISKTKIDDDYCIGMTRYSDEQTAIHNYLLVNRLPGGIGILGRDNGVIYLMSIVPKGTEVLNTESVSIPRYYDEFKDPPIIYELEIANQQLARIASRMGARPDIYSDLGEMSSQVVRQTYQRIIGASCTPENSDHFLVAMSELVRGAWSSQTGYKLLAMAHAWISRDDDVKFLDYRDSAREIIDLLRNRDNQVAISNSASSFWSWMKMTNIAPGPDIDSERVIKSLSIIDRYKLQGGAPTAIFNLSPKPLVLVKEMRGQIDSNGFLFGSQNYIFQMHSADAIEDDDDGFYDIDEWYGDEDEIF